MTNSGVAGSYMAVVRIERASEPWPVSVSAKQPGSRAANIAEPAIVVRRRAEIEDRAAEQTELHPELTTRLKSPNASVSNAAIAAAGSFLPPHCSGYASAPRPSAASNRVHSSTRVR